MENKESKSVLRTKRMLKLALADNLLNNGNKSITVTDIIKSADLTRTTFYTYYDNYEVFYKSVISETYNKIANQLIKLLSEGEKKAYENTRKKNLIIDDIDLQLLKVMSVTKVLEKDLSFTYNDMFYEFYKNRNELFDEEYIINNLAKIDFFCVGYVMSILDDSIDFNSKNLYNDIMLTFELAKKINLQLKRSSL